MKAIRDDVLCRQIIDYIMFVLCSGNAGEARKTIQYLQRLHQNPAEAGHWVIESNGGYMDNDFSNVSWLLNAVVGEKNVGYWDDPKGVDGKVIILSSDSGSDVVRSSYKHANIVAFGLNDHSFLHQKLVTHHYGYDDLETVTDDDYREYCRACKNGQLAFLYYIQNIAIYEPPLILRSLPKFYPVGYYTTDSRHIRFLGETLGSNNAPVLPPKEFFSRLSQLRKGEAMTTFIDVNTQDTAALIDKFYVMPQ